MQTRAWVLAFAVVTAGCAASRTEPRQTSTVNAPGASVTNGSIVAYSNMGNVSPVTTNTTDLKIALDPKAFKDLFGPAGVAAGAVEATSEQLAKLQDYTDKNKDISPSDRSDLRGKIAQCLNGAKKCIVEPLRQ